MTELHAEGPRPFGAVISAAPDVEALTERLRGDGTGSVELVAGAGHVVGLHLGTVVRHGIRDVFAQSGIVIESVGSTVALNVDQPDEGVVADVDAYLKLAADLGARRLKLTIGRVPAGSGPHDPGTVAAGRVSQRLAAVLNRATELGVQLAVENSGQMPGAEELAAVLEAAGLVPAVPDAVQPAGAVWNVRESVAAGETLAESAKLLRPYLDSGLGYILCDSAAAATALTEAVPEAAEVPILVEEPRA